MTLFGKRFTLIRLLLSSLFILLLLDGCVPLSPGSVGPGPGSRDLIGSLRIFGNNVSLNQNRAQTGMNVYDGDTINTGPDSSAIIYFTSGGLIQLDQNTDPNFVFTLIEQTKCILFRILKGQAYVDSHQICFDTPTTSGVLNSRVNIKVTPGQSVITVLQGSVAIKRPHRLLAEGSEQITMSERSMREVSGLSERDLRLVISWRERYNSQEGWCCSEGQVFQSYMEECRQRGGYFSYSDKAAYRRCQPQTGYCCQNGEVFKTYKENCQGYFSYNEGDARLQCQTPPESFPSNPTPTQPPIY